MKLRNGANAATPQVLIITRLEPATFEATGPEDCPSNP